LRTMHHAAGCRLYVHGTALVWWCIVLPRAACTISPPARPPTASHPCSVRMRRLTSQRGPASGSGDSDLVQAGGPAAPATAADAAQDAAAESPRKLRKRRKPKGLTERHTSGDAADASEEDAGRGSALALSVLPQLSGRPLYTWRRK
jgi:hypothetical protein